MVYKDYIITSDNGQSYMVCQKTKTKEGGEGKPKVLGYPSGFPRLLEFISERETLRVIGGDCTLQEVLDEVNKKNKELYDSARRIAEELLKEKK